DQILKVKFEIKDISVSDDAFYFYLFDLDLYEETLSKINNFLEINQSSKHLLEGKINVQGNNDILFTSVPYEPGMKVKVDGMVVSPIRLLDTFIGLKLTPGEHTITFDFFPNGLKEGIIISSLTLLVVIGYYINKKENL
ncbi:MAG: YfhO family protein, partial [Mollicutes bacterium]|nr:YfhO family protein [Mollicutes bacterium]